MKQKGFTLIELMVVIVIISVFAAVVAPAMSGLVKSSVLNSSARRVFSLARYARTMSIYENKNYRLNLNIKKKRYWLTRESSRDNSYGIYERLRTGVGRDYTLPSGISFKKTGNDPFSKGLNDIRYSEYHPDGSAEPFDFIVIDKERYGYKVETSPATGLTRLINYNAEK